ncbi:hypothetical protein RJ640_023720 [Escallonia rubra]|uniref:X8 domain-containing protein n=1 Tax=Escallonia rubra TaxID=112253 RepID=A0AA88S876_9ASTE|nr:hypothetical protein RJ640_023720 [Escallonia rubra]
MARGEMRWKFSNSGGVNSPLIINFVKKIKNNGFFRNGQFEQWCIADEQTADADLHVALDWACGKGNANCSMIQVNQPCYLPNTVGTMLHMPSTVTIRSSSTMVQLATLMALPLPQNLIPNNSIINDDEISLGRHWDDYSHDNGDGGRSLEMAMYLRRQLDMGVSEMFSKARSPIPGYSRIDGIFRQEAYLKSWIKRVKIGKMPIKAKINVKLYEITSSPASLSRFEFGVLCDSFDAGWTMDRLNFATLGTTSLHFSWPHEMCKVR